MTGIGWLLVLFLASKAKSSSPALPTGTPSQLPLGTTGIVKFSNIPQVPVKFEMIQRGGKSEAAWVIQELVSSNLATLRPKLKGSVGKVFPIVVSDGRTFKGRWDNNVFVPVA